MKIAVLASGRGTNALKLVEACLRGDFGASEIVALVSDREDSGALAEGRRLGVKTFFIDPEKKGATLSEKAAQKYLETLRAVGAELVVLAGFMRIVPSPLIDAYRGRMINLHPSLLPAFKGKDAIRQAWDHGVKIGGCSVHYVSEELDGGRIIAQRAVEVREGDTFEDFERRVHEAEHILLPAVVASFAKGC